MSYAVEEVARLGDDDGVRIDLDDQVRVPLDDPDTFALIRSTRTLGHVPDRVAGAARAGRQVRPGDLRRPDHRHLAVPARPCQERHGHPVPQGPAGAGRARVPARDSALRPRETAGVVRLPRAGAADHLDVHRRHLAEADEARRALGARKARTRSRCGCGRGLARGYDAPPSTRSGRCSRRSRRSASARRTPRRSRCRPTSRPGSRPTTRRVPRRGAHPRPRHVPEAADPRRRPPVRHRGAAADVNVRRTTGRAAPTCAPLPGRRHGGWQRRGTASGWRWRRSRASPRRRWPGWWPAGPTARWPTSGTGPGCPPGRRAAGAHRRLRRALRAGVGGHRPVRPAAAG
jgi:hypothetical protein